MIDIEKQYMDSLQGKSFIDLFAGIGAFRMALESFGANCVFSCEWDKDAQNTYAMNYGDIPVGDITKISEFDIPQHDILCAGFPCQPFLFQENNLVLMIFEELCFLMLLVLLNIIIRQSFCWKMLRILRCMTVDKHFLL